MSKDAETEKPKAHRNLASLCGFEAEGNVERALLRKVNLPGGT